MCAPMSFSSEDRPVVQYAAGTKHARTWVPQCIKVIDGVQFVDLRQTDNRLALLPGLDHSGKAKYFSKTMLLEDLRNARNARVEEILLDHLHAQNPCEQPACLPEGFNRMLVNPDDLPQVMDVYITNVSPTFKMKMVVELMQLRVSSIELSMADFAWLENVATVSAVETPHKRQTRRPEDRVEMPTPEAKFDYRRKSVYMRCKDADGRVHLKYLKPTTTAIDGIANTIDALKSQIDKKGWAIGIDDSDDEDVDTPPRGE